MRVYEIAKEFGVENAEILDALKDKGVETKGQMSSVKDEDYDALKETFAEIIKQREEARLAEEQKRIEEEAKATAEKAAKAQAMNDQKKNARKFVPGDQIPCFCVRPNRVIAIGDRTHSVYTWDGYGEIVDVDYSDIQAWKASKKAYITNPQIIIMDEELYDQWAKDLDPIYEVYLGIDRPEEFFDMNDVVFKKKLETSPRAFQELIKIQARKMIKEGTFNSLTKLAIIDDVCGTALREFV